MRYVLVLTLRSNVRSVVMAALTMYPPVVWATPLGLPVEPEV